MKCEFRVLHGSSWQTYMETCGQCSGGGADRWTARWRSQRSGAAGPSLLSETHTQPLSIEVQREDLFFPTDMCPPMQTATEVRILEQAHLVLSKRGLDTGNIHSGHSLQLHLLWHCMQLPNEPLQLRAEDLKHKKWINTIWFRSHSKHWIQTPRQCFQEYCSGTLTQPVSLPGCAASGSPCAAAASPGCQAAPWYWMDRLPHPPLQALPRLQKGSSLLQSPCGQLLMDRILG